MKARNSQSDPKSKWQPRPASLQVRSVACLIAIDLVGIVAGFAVTVFARDAFFGGKSWFYFIPTLIPLYVVAAINNHAYTSDNLNQPLRAVARSLRSLLFSVIFIVILGFSIKANENISRLVLAIGFLLSCIFVSLGRYFFIRHFKFFIGGNPFNVVIIRDGDHPLPAGDFSVILAADAQFDPNEHDPAMYDRLAKALQSADRVIVACPSEQRAAWTHALKGISVQGEILVGEFASLFPLGMGKFGTTPTMVVSAGPLGLGDRAIKRLFDILISGSAILILSPLLLAVALAVRLESSGPALFRQTRIGRDNELFEIFKYRSMHIHMIDKAGHRSASRNDNRITRVGRIIRATSVDELPQLFNVFKGDMSLVGPRPHALGSRAADKLFWEVDQRYWHRHAVKPGMTGLAQIRGFRGATLVEADLSNRLQADLEYLEHWTIWRDVRIIFMTFRTLLHRNAF